MVTAPRWILMAAVLAGCGKAPPPSQPTPVAGPVATLAQVYYWRARPGKLEEYSRYIREIAEPIDMEARREGAFVSVTTFESRDSTTPWTHMRIFLLRDSVQLRALGDALDRAGVRVEPDSAKRRAKSDYGATLRDRVGSAVLEILK